ncbi:hypothetical protein EB001_01855 [bacterium]|jgi:hypothetical protein|nr:hypothetical protein [bacterium]
MDSINNLKDSRCYLVGAMDRVKDGGKSWREKITLPLIHIGVKVLNPCKKILHSFSEEDSRHWIEYYKETGQFSRIREEFGFIRSADLRCVDISDFIIVHIDVNTHACGTYEEITTANRQKKPILVWCEQGKSHAPNWLFFMLPHEHIFNSMEEIINYLNYIDSLQNTKGLQRWFFFSNLYNQ